MKVKLGEHIRSARTARGLSLRAVASDAGISASMLSQVETGKVQPSVSTLYAIANVLGLSVDDMIGHDPDTRPRRPSGDGPVLRWADAPEIAMENGVTWRGMATLNPDGGVSSVLATYPPGASSSLDESHMRHEGIEHAVIVRGELTLKLGFDTYVLKAGDSLCFDSSRPHYYRNHTDEVAEGVWFIVQPGRGGEPGPSATGTVGNAVDMLHAMGRLSAPPGT